MKKILCVFIAFIMFIGLASCMQGTKKRDILAIAIENIKQPLRQMNERFSVYEEALDSTKTYTASPTEENLKKAKVACSGAIARIAKLQDASINLSDTDIKEMMDIGLNTEDYSVPFRYSNYYKNENIQTLSLIIYYLNQAPDLNDVLEYVVSFNIVYQAMNRQVEYLCINELFCKFSGKEINSFKNEFLPSLEVLSSDKLPWETDSESLEAKAGKLLTGAEVSIDDYSKFIGEQYEILLMAQSNYKDILLSAGYGEAEVDKIISEIDKMSSMSQLLP